MIYVFLVIAIGVFAWVNYDLRRRGRQMEMDSSEDWYLQRSYFGRLLAKNKKKIRGLCGKTGKASSMTLMRITKQVR